MAKIGFGSEFKTKSAFDYPKLSLTQSEKARICVIDNPEVEFVHTLREVLLVNGKPEMEQKVWKNKTTEVPKKSFRGKFICLGDPDTLEKRGVDPNNCPACKASVENGDAVEGPKRRFVVHVLKYNTKKNSFSVNEPYQVELMAWEFAESRFNLLCDIQEEHGDLNRVDLILGPCESQTFQKFTITAGGTCVWASDEKKKATSIEVIKNQKSEDLTPLLGRTVTASELSTEVHDILSIYNDAFGIAGDLPSTKDSGFTQDFSELLGDTASAEAEKSEADTSEETEASTKDDSEEEDLSSLLASFK